MSRKQTTAKKIISIDKAKKSSQKPMKGREILVQSLENEGVDTIFGLSWWCLNGNPSSAHLKQKN